ncbi:FAD binding domain-containing protein [Ralstonia solanacearum]|uniref:Xanthine dehydrogenase family protein subunit M n=1 Tax=Ralstonia solanacearum TaxID=305 RepID=A0AAW5ZLX2_RALSL|nr:xanthine dehydrogenase family protein subunit M [Ralstonia solanacearum]AST32025.2 xanthine dehydrogenase family protein subunit M [Ralstonia solanacearum]ATJ86466.1 carbon monoxide dehydrogenase [Ralstonia solanacearum]AYB51631.1 xanthine dehydrogenase family protein subunit M [Ralstonia solanacearum]AYB56185.1 xanthine dehydrogenase family protein subunit M [Ralstonia solanacearum]MBB6591313.1 xanthine dehydrogenase family protein subunit M [Ralstonia solanacearum]
MYAFEYHKATDAQTAVTALKTHPDSKYLGGGQSLLAAMKLRLAQPSTLVDITRIPGLAGIRTQPGIVTVGAATCHADVAESDDVRRMLPALAELAGGIGDRQVRAMGTLGGSLANNDPAACYPAAVLGLNATVVTERRDIAADDFFRGMYETALAPDELITEVQFPVPDQAAYVKFRNPASRFALVGVFVSRKGSRVRVAVTGAAPCVFRCAPLEQALSANFTSETARHVTVSSDELVADLHASPEYRAHLIPVLAARAVEQALARHH